MASIKQELDYEHDSIVENGHSPSLDNPRSVDPDTTEDINEEAMDLAADEEARSQHSNSPMGHFQSNQDLFPNSLQSQETVALPMSNALSS